TAAFTPTSAQLGAGIHSIVAVYNGNATYAPSPSLPFSQAVNATAANLGTLVVTPVPPSAPLVYGTPLAFSVSVTSNSAINPLGGTGNFSDGSTLLGTGTVDATGHATLSTSALAVGTHSNLTAAFVGNTNFNASLASSPAVSHTVNPAVTGTAITSPSS